MDRRLNAVTDRGLKVHHVAVTGASSGLGAALSRYYAAQGCLLSLAGRDVDRLCQVAKDCERLGGTVARHCVDVTDRAGMADWLLTRDDAQPVDLLIANAGLGGNLALSNDPDANQALISVNLIGVVNTVEPLRGRMAKRRSGRIAIMSSMAALIGLPDSPVYSATKAAVLTYGEALRRDLAPAGVRVTVICPGFVDTPMSRSLSGPRPRLMSPDAAAAHIGQALARNRPVVIFPGSLRLGIAVARAAPIRVVDWVLSRPRLRARK